MCTSKVYVVSFSIFDKNYFIKPKRETRTMLFLVTKISRKSYLIFSSATSMLWVVPFAILIHDHLSSQKLKAVKHRFWLQKEIKSHMWYVFLIHDPQIVDCFICYFWLITILSSQKLKNVKYRFWLQKEVKIISAMFFWFAIPKL